ncbi:NAD(P)H:quinone oxidoreductase [Iodidimonas sp. SYSU 1G8]|uniref:NAD(P)H:quinone oxidoreductase n=1 Tax=Iodidimonas sp. SYSU 1G8 TaxID=3133967 RepID=UPI0031FE82CF
MSVRVLVLYHSMYGHVETMAKAVAEGVTHAGGTPTLGRVPELMPEDAFRKAGGKTDQVGEIIEPASLADYDALIIGTPTRYGSMSGQMRNFLDQTGGLWQKGALVGKVGSAFASTATQHGGQETTLINVHVTLLHLGMVVVGLPYSFAGQTTLEEISGGSPYGATTIAGSKGERQPSRNELEGARFQGRHVTDIARRLSA